MAQHWVKASVALIALAILFAVCVPLQAGTKPTVVSTYPSDMASDISPTIPSFTVTFSKPMDTSHGVPFTNGWPAAYFSWSADKTVYTFTRHDLTPLASGITLIINLNPSYAPADIMFRDTEGNLLDAFSFLFTIAGGQTGLSKVAADPQNGFSWPYYLYIPLNVKNPGVLLVEPNNTGTVSDDPAVHDAAARSLIENKRYWADELGSPYLVPTFPRPATGNTGYTHALDRGTILTTVAGLERIDLQLMAMIRDAQLELSGKGVSIGSKVFLVGASASGSFVSRFTMLHPEVVRAASIGAPGFGPIVPVSSWNGQNLVYPEGIADLENLVGKKFDAATFRTVPLQIWVGDEDDNVDPYWYGSDPSVAVVKAAFGGHYLYSRWPRYEAAYCSVTSLAQFVVFPEMGHQWADWSYIREFLDRNRASAQTPLEKPLQYKIYFPHVASYERWETEIALVNTVPGGIGVHGHLKAYNKEGGNPLEEIDVVVPVGGRREITVGEFFQNPEAIDYIVFLSDSGFLAGYTRFNDPGGRVSLPATTGVLQGWFPKMDNDGWTGLAFLNVDSETANMRFTAIGESGQKVGEEAISLAPGVKTVAIVWQFFHTDISNARYFYFSSDKKIVAFSVSGSSDGQMLDGIPVLSEYLR
jgi:hypothetical protein